jgi:hypothetical protein
MESKIIIDDLYFHSYDHIRYESGFRTSGPHKNGAKRAIEIKSNNSSSYSVSIFNIDGKHPIWKDNIQMSPKQMKIAATSETETKLKGYGVDLLGGDFSNYGITINHPKREIEDIQLHMFDRDIDIKYLKSEFKKNLEPNYFRSDGEFHSLPSFFAPFQQDLIGYLQSLERKKKPDIVYVSDIIEVTGIFAIEMMGTYKRDVMGILPAKIAIQIKETMTEVVASLIPNMEEKENKVIFSNYINKRILEPNIFEIAQKYLSSLERY